LGIALKLTFSGNNQLYFGSTWFFVALVACSVVTQMNYLNMVGPAKEIHAPRGGPPSQLTRRASLRFPVHCPPIHSCWCSSAQALDTFNTAVVTPIYYVLFTTATIAASGLLFRGWTGSECSVAGALRAAGHARRRTLSLYSHLVLGSQSTSATMAQPRPGTCPPAPTRRCLRK
jgi:hypothetical protein